jgi:hypothetical protein
MATRKISDLTSASALSGSEVLPVVQGGTTKKVTAQAIADLASGGGGGSQSIDINVTGGTVGSSVSIPFYYYATVPNESGSLSPSIEALPSINISGGGGYGGGTFTATSIQFPTLQKASDFMVSGTSTLQTLSAPQLTEVTNNVNPTYNSALTSVSLPNLVKVGNLYFGNMPLMTASNFNFSSLQEVNNLSIQANQPGITGFRQTMFPALRKAGQINWGGSYQPSFEVDLPLLTDFTSGFNGSNSANLTRINLPGLVNSPAYLAATYTSTLTDVVLGTIGTLKKGGSGGSSVSLYFQYSSLSQASIDGILTLYASLDGTNGTTVAEYGSMYLTGGSNAAPSSTGLAAISVLIARGWYIQHN